MNSKLLTRFGVLLALSATCFVRSALGDPEGAPAGSEGRASQRVDDSPAAPALDPRLLIRLQQQEIARRAARKEALKDPKGWDDNRAQRASAHRARLAALWGNVVGTIDGQAHLRIHADRMARLNRMLDLAELKNDSRLVARIRLDISRELARDMQAMRQLQVASGMP